MKIVLNTQRFLMINVTALAAVGISLVTHSISPCLSHHRKHLANCIDYTWYKSVYHTKFLPDLSVWLLHLQLLASIKICMLIISSILTDGSSKINANSNIQYVNTVNTWEIKYGFIMMFLMLSCKNILAVQGAANNLHSSTLHESMAAWSWPLLTV